MSAQTKIEWTDSTWNPWIGCTRVSPACDDCYAARSTPARRYGIKWGAGQPRRRTSDANWKLPLRWNHTVFVQCEKCGHRGDGKPWLDATEAGGVFDNGFCCANCGSRDAEPTRRRVFCASLADWLDNEAPIEWFVDLLDLIRRTPNLDWLLLSKRIGNWVTRLNLAEDALPNGSDVDQNLRQWIINWLEGTPPPNVWLGATVVNQDEADRDIPKLLRVPARIRFLSIEPMLGPVDLRGYIGAGRQPWGWCHGLSWVIAGGESGSKARPMHPDWVRSLRDQCAAAGVPFLFKQWGEWVPADSCPADAPVVPELFLGRCGAVRGAEVDFFGGDSAMYRLGKKAAGRLLDGVHHTEFPA
jgi:protein gp37